jgi:SAM-dependent methyltransferase
VKNIEEILDACRPRGVRIDLGCGAHKQEGFLGVDARDLPGVDLVHDLEEFPWPLPDNCAELVIASHLVEHINPAKYGFIKFMDEVWRILIPGGKFMASMPYAGSPGYWQDPTHINPVNEATWAYFDPFSVDGVLYAVYEPKPWKIIQNTWAISGNIEVALERREEESR